MKILIGSKHANVARSALGGALICGMLLILPSCGIPDLRQPKLGYPPPERFNLPHPIPGYDLPAPPPMAAEGEQPAASPGPSEVIQTSAEVELPAASANPPEPAPEPVANASPPEPAPEPAAGVSPPEPAPEPAEDGQPAASANPPAAMPAAAENGEPAENSNLPNVFPLEAGGSAFPDDPDAPRVASTSVGEGVPDANSARVRVEEFFQDPTLSILINQALAGNYELKILAEEIQVASNDFWGRTGAYLPFVRSANTFGMDKLSLFTPLGVAEDRLDPIPGKPFPEWPANFLMAANITWQVDYLRQLRNARDATRLRFFATSEGRNYIVTRLVADVASNYYKLKALDARLEKLNGMIKLQEASLQFALAAKEAARATELAVQRFEASVRRFQSEKLLVTQEIIQTENDINFLLGRYPQPVERGSGDFDDFVELNLRSLHAGLPSQILQNRPDVRQVERELSAAGLDIRVARVNFFPKLALAGPMGPEGPFSPIGWQAFDWSNLFRTPDAMVASIAGDLVTPVINKRAIQAEYQNANARQLQALYHYQEIILQAFNEVYNRLSRVERFGKSVEIKQRQVTALEKSVQAAMDLFQNPRAGAEIDYLDVLTAQTDLLEAQLNLIDTKLEQLVAVVNAYQALGGGSYLSPLLDPMKLQPHHNWFTGKFHAVAPKIMPPWPRWRRQSHSGHAE